VLVVAVAVSDNGKQNNKTFEYAIGLWGDLPYSDTQALQAVPNLIADMNYSEIEFSVHDGDLKAGSGTPGSTTPTDCSDAMYTQGLGYLNSLRKAAIFTPGDNDWTDCDRSTNGSHNDVERLQHERQVFFSTDHSLGRQTMQQTVHSWPSTRLATQPTSSGSRRPSTRRTRWARPP
jgi:hypothetical protein